MHQEPLNPAAAATADKLARVALVEIEARSALIARGCLATNLLLPTLAVQLGAVNCGDETHAQLRVYAIDAKGDVRTGPRGPMSARDALDRLLIDNPDFLKFFSP